MQLLSLCFCPWTHVQIAIEQIPRNRITMADDLHIVNFDKQFNYCFQRACTNNLFTGEYVGISSFIERSTLDRWPHFSVRYQSTLILKSSLYIIVISLFPYLLSMILIMSIMFFFWSCFWYFFLQNSSLLHNQIYQTFHLWLQNIISFLKRSFSI